MMFRQGACAFAALLAASCASKDGDPRAQWIATVSTDAPVPTYGDQLFVEVLAADGSSACGTCSRQFGIASSESLPLSFGIEAFDSAKYARVRLYRSAVVGWNGLPAGSSLIDALVALPPDPSVDRISIALRFDCFGIPAVPASGESCDPATRSLATAPVGRADPAIEAGSSSLALAAPCDAPAPSDMRCVPGGAVLLGDVTLPELAGTLSANPERLAHLRPFFLDEREVSVGDYRTLAPAHPEFPGSPGTVFDPRCTFIGSSDATNDALPLNCVTPELARAICAARGARLPTEAEWEHAASNRRESPFPWGDDFDECAHAIVGRAESPKVTVCRAGTGTILSPGPSAVDRSDCADVTSDGIRDLGGNMAEWVEDQPAPFDSGCWNPDANLLENPVCAASPDLFAGRAMTRGGAWESLPIFARSAARNLPILPQESRDVGVRCAHD